MNDLWRRRAHGRGERGYTFMELMIVLAIIAILMAAILGPIRFAMRRGKLVKTQSDVRAVGLAWCAYFDGTYQNCGPGVPIPTDVPVLDFPVILDGNQRLELETVLGITLPQFDAWGKEVEYRVDDWPGATRLMIRSRNRDGAWDVVTHYLWQLLFPETDEMTDIVWVNCHFVQYWSAVPK